MTEAATSPTLAFAGSFYASLDADDVEAVVRLCADDVVVAYPASALLPYGGIWHGHDGLRRFLQEHDQAEEILTFEPGPITVDGDVVYVRGTFEGRAKPDGAVWTTTFVHVLTISAGRLARWEAFFDTAAAMQAHRLTGR